MALTSESPVGEGVGGAVSTEQTENRAVRVSLNYSKGLAGFSAYVFHIHTNIGRLSQASFPFAFWSTLT